MPISLTPSWAAKVVDENEQQLRQREEEERRLARIRQNAASLNAPPNRATPPRPRVQLPSGTNGETISVGVRPAEAPSPQPQQPRRPFAGPQAPPQSTPGSAIRDLGQQLYDRGLDAARQMARQLDPMNFRDSDVPSAPPAPQGQGLSFPDPTVANDMQRRQNRSDAQPSMSAQLTRVQHTPANEERQQWEERAAVTDEQLRERGLNARGDARSAGSPGAQRRETEELVGAAYDRQRDAAAIQTAEAKVSEYQRAMAAYVERREAAADGMIPFSQVGDPPPYPSFTAAERGVLGISHDAEVGSPASWAEYAADPEMWEAYVRNTGRLNPDGSVPKMPKDAWLDDDDYRDWVSDSFGDLDPEDRDSAMQAASGQLNATHSGPMKYDPQNTRVSPNPAASARTDPRQQGDLLYRDVDEDGNPVQNIRSAQGRGARVPVHGATESGGTSYARRTAGGDALALATGGIPDSYKDANGKLKPEYADENGNLLPQYQVDLPGGNGSAEDEQALYYAQSVGYDLSGLPHAERIGKARKIYEDHRRRGRSFDAVWDDAAGEEGDFRYKQNMESRRRAQGRQAMARTMDSIERNPRAWNSTFLGEDGKPDNAKIEAWLQANGYLDADGNAPSIDSTFLGPNGQPEAAHPADKARAKNEMIRRIASAMGRSEAWQQNLQMRGNEQNMRNPMLARQMLMRSIQEAEQRGASPQEIAHIYTMYGMNGAAAAEYQYGTAQMNANATVDAARAGREPEEPTVGQQMFEADNSIMQPFFEDPNNVALYNNTARYTENLIRQEYAGRNEPAPDDEEITSMATTRIAQNFLASQRGRNARSAATVNGEQDSFLRSPAISNYLESFAESIDERTWFEYIGNGMGGNNSTKKEKFLEQVMSRIGLTEDYRDALELWFDTWARTTRGG